MRPSRVLALIFAVLVFPSTVWAQQTIYGCVKNSNGQIRIVAAGERCLPSEHDVQWTLGGAASLPAPPAPAAPAPLRVVDQNDVAVGVLASPGYVARQVNGSWVALPVNTTGFRISSPGSLMPFYQTTNCSGDMYLMFDATSMLRVGTVTTGTDGKLAFSYPGATVVDGTTIHSIAYYYSGNWVCYGTSLSASDQLGKAELVDVSTFKAPFKIVQ